MRIEICAIKLEDSVYIIVPARTRHKKKIMSLTLKSALGYIVKGEKGWVFDPTPPDGGMRFAWRSKSFPSLIDVAKVLSRIESGCTETIVFPTKRKW